MNDASQPPAIRGITLERYASLTALVHHVGSERAPSLLASFGISSEVWEEADATWIAFLADTDGEAARTFVTVFAGTLRSARGRASYVAATLRR